EVVRENRYFPLGPGSTFYAPTGVQFALSGYPGEDLVVYLWRAELPPDRRPGRNRKWVSRLFDDTTSFRPTLEPDSPLAPATMNLIHWPGTGSPLLSLHCGIQQPHQSFVVHRHPRS